MMPSEHEAEINFVLSAGYLNKASHEWAPSDTKHKNTDVHCQHATSLPVVLEHRLSMHFVPKTFQVHTWKNQSGGNTWQAYLLYFWQYLTGVLAHHR